MPKVFVTGSDGLLGSNLVRELVQRKYEVIAMVQPGNKSATLKDLPIQIAYGDITKRETVVQLSKGCDYFIHVAAITDVWPIRDEKYYKVNVEGTQNVVEAVLANKIKKLIHVGSASSFGFGTLDNPGNESDDNPCITYNLDYVITKKMGQELVIDAVKKRNLPATVVCPTFMIGPYDAKPSSGALVLSIIRKKILALPSGGKNWVAAKDVAVGICNAIEKGKIGECYILGGQNLSYKEAVKQIAESIGEYNYPKAVIPDLFVKLIGRIAPVVAAITKKQKAFSYPLACISCNEQYYSAQKAINELDLPQRPIGEAVKELKLWFEQNGYL